MLPTFFVSLNLPSLGLLAPSDIDEIANTAVREANPAELRGDVDTSLESDDTRLAYRLLDGDQIAHHLPTLDRLYRTTILQLASRASGLGLCVSPNVVNGVNVNVLQGAAARYEWHVDSNPLTGLLVLTESNAESGGRLLFGQEPSSQVALALRPGQLLLFDARSAPHCVEALRHESTRVTAPMNFFIAGEAVSRPEGLDEALYGQ